MGPGFGRGTRTDFAAILSSAIAVVGFGIGLMHWGQYDQEITSLEVTDTSYLRMADDAMQREFQLVVSDLNVLLGSDDLHRFLEGGSEEARADVAASFENFARSKSIYDQIRFLSVDGREQVRVDLTEGDAMRVPRSKLQDKSDRYYFKDAIRLAPGELFVSPMDLNTEGGEIQVPYKPVQRFATPVADAGGEVVGIVILNHLAVTLLGRLDSIEGGAGETHLLNGDGYWLSAPDASLEWGFMFPDGPSFAEQHPEVWAAAHAGSQSTLETDAGHFSFPTIDPSGSSPGAGEDTAASSSVRHDWKLVTHIPQERMTAILMGHVRTGGIEFGLAFLLLAPMCWGFAEARNRRRLAMADLISSEQRFASVTDSVPDAIVTVDGGEKVVSWNRAAATIFGLGEANIAGMPLSWMIRNTEPRGTSKLLALPTGESREMIGMRHCGEGFPVEITVGRWSDGELEFVSIVARDISARREAEDAKANLETELLHARKLEAVGQLAAGIAHEINTPTQFVGDNTRFLKDAFDDVLELFQLSTSLVDELEAAGSAELAGKLRDCLDGADVDFLEEEIPRAIDQSLEGLSRVSKIVGAMKEFAHPGAVGKSASDINHCVESTIIVATNEWKYACDMELQLDPDLPPVVCCPGEINQVILNIVVNAAHAVAEGLGEQPTSKGCITISTERSGELVELRIGDNGAGMPEDIRERIFEPFFTTKAVGKGSGQGLAIAYDVICHKHGGSIDVASELGVGTTFIIRIPIQPQEAEAIAAGAQDD